VVDDNGSNRDLLERRLSHEGHQVLSVASGQAALDLLERTEVDLILLDLMMPGLNGFEVLQRLKASERFFEIPVIMISGLKETDSVIRCIEAGAEDYLAKPFNPVILRARIRAGLERKRWRDRERHYLAQIEREKARHEALLHNILPGEVVARLNGGELVIADRFDQATILLADLVGFTAIAASTPAAEMVALLNRIFSEFDRLCRRWRIEKIKTIGDAYIAAAGLPEWRPDHARSMVEFARAMLLGLKRINAEQRTAFELRIGIHTGPVIAGVIGEQRFLYDVWGESVNLASRLESHGAPGRIHVSMATRQALAKLYRFEERGIVTIKGLGEVRTAFLMDEPRLRETL
jgi:class 3 adenylate cyclase